MISELQILIYSYLQLEEVLTLTKDNTKLCDIILKRYHQNLPSLETCCKNGNFETFLYLYNHGHKYNPETIITDVLNSGNFQFLKFVLTNMISSREVTYSSMKYRYMTEETIK